MSGRSVRAWSAFATVIVMILAFAGVTPVSANVIATTGQLIKISPPTDVLQSGLCSTDKVFTFDEQQDVTLGADVRVDYTVPGSYNAYAVNPIPSVPSGTVVDSHFLDSNLGQCGGIVNREGTWKFSQDILGVIVARPRLVNSDYLGAPTTAYPGSVPSREFDFGSGTSADFVQIIDARTVYVKLQTTFSNADQMRVLTKHNSPPIPNAGGPYVGTEGSAVALTGTAPDPDSDAVTKSWTFAWPTSPGVSCTTTGTTTLTPTITCNDDALVTATLSVSDGYHPAVTSVANVTIENRNPTISSVTVPIVPVALGASVSLSSAFADVGSHDTHTASIAWGDTTITGGSVNEAGHSVNASHIYTTPGVYSLTLTVNDDNGGTVSVTTTDVTVVGPPTLSAGGPYNVDEGSPITLAGSASGSLPLTKSWAFTPGPSDFGTTCSNSGGTTLTPIVSCNDDVVVGAALTVSDGVNAPAVSTSSIAVTNVAPVLGSLTATAGPIIAGQSVTVGGSFTDVGVNDTHSSTVDWGDLSTSSATVSESGGSGSVSANHSYTAPGVYTVAVDVSDGDGGIDTRTVTIRVNTPPTASAGGPYVGPEGSTLTLGASASDADADLLSTTWSFSVAGPPPSACTFGLTSTLAPTVLCTDDAVITATLTVSDGVNAAVLRTATVTVGNVAPSVGAVTTSASPVAIGAPASASLSFSDAGSRDTHTATIDWGDGNTTAASISESGGAGTASGTHPYAAAGSYTVTITVTDDDGDSSAATAVMPIVVNAPPTAGAGGPYSGNEGSVVSLTGTASDPEGGSLTKSWSFAQAADPGTTCTPAGAATLTPTITCNDNAVVLATLTVSDGINSPVTSVATVTFGNVVPAVSALTATPSIQAVGANVSASATFTDVGTHDTHTATIDWGDGSSSATVTESAGAGSATGSHVYADAGIYTVYMTVTDDNGESSTVSTSVVVYDPTAPFVTANGNFASPSGAYTPDNPSDPNVTGPAHIDFLARYQHDDTVPTGHGAFRFNAANLTLNATGFAWLVVTPAGDETFFRGTGEVNGVSGYEFLVSGIDGSPDLVRIKVWQTSTGTVVYDSQPGAADDADPVLALTGSLMIH